MRKHLIHMRESSCMEPNAAENAIFPCIFPVNREFQPQTGLLGTVCTATHFPVFRRREIASVLLGVFRGFPCRFSDRDENVSANQADFGVGSQFAIPAVRVCRIGGSSGLQLGELIALV